jgi:tRNA threonylcarbamoyladenosine biosynthesis protein TsaE
MLQLRASSIADTHAIAQAVADVSRAGDIVVLAGEMGAGKTAFAQGFGRALGIAEPMTSPTFTLVHSYELDPPARGIRMLHHADLYRLDRTSEVADLALAELAEYGGAVLVEWGDVVEGAFGDHLTVFLDLDPDDASDDLAIDRGRLIEILGTGFTWASRWERLRTSVQAFAC